MKLIIALFSTLLAMTVFSSLASAATYEVPVPEKFKDAAVFELKNASLKQTSPNQFVMGYEIPDDLSAGSSHYIQFTGQKNSEGFIEMTSPDAFAQCHDSAGDWTCLVRYYQTFTDKESGLNFINEKFADQPQMLEAKAATFTEFIEDPFGIIRIQLEKGAY